MPQRRPHELVGARELVRHRATELEHRERREVFGEELLLATEAAADPVREHADAVALEAEDVREFVAGEERHLRRRAEDEAALVVEPPDGSVRLERRVCDARRTPLAAHRGVARGEGFVDVAAVAGVEAGDDVAVGRHHPLLGGAVGVQQGSAGAARVLGIEDGGEHGVLHADRAAAGIRGLRRLGHDRGDPLAHVPHDVVEHARVVGIVGAVFVAAGGVTDVGDVGVGEHRDDAGDRERVDGVDGGDPRVRVG
ncbi:hypothetical protein SRABI128_03297 [Microbacterium sp. Bi128]|nr:hypothetical protein SRABI128_03297 [Microbacterium sp. Bi128]